MDRRPGRALQTTYVRPGTTPGRFQARTRDAKTGRDVKVTAASVELAVRESRRKAARP